MDFDLVVRGGIVVTAADTFEADLGIRGEKIAALGRHLDGSRVIDASGMLVIPGGVDPHVHLQMSTGVTVSSDDWLTGTRAAAFGGTTTIIDFVEPQPGETLMQAFEARRAEADGQAVIDYGLHMTLNQTALDHLDNVPDCCAAGMTSFKTYTTYEGFKLSDAEMLEAMRWVSSVGGIMMTHCETDAIVQQGIKRFTAKNDLTNPHLFSIGRPAVAEYDAIRHMLQLADIMGTSLYVVHISTQGGAQAIADARRTQRKVFGETCPQYLYLTHDSLKKLAGFEKAKLVCQPPLRTARDCVALADYLRSGDLQSVGTDHCPFNFVGQKDLGQDDFTQIPGGLPGIESRLALLYRDATRPDTGLPLDLGLSLNRWVEVCCTNPAKIFGLYPRKGTLMPGADADIVIFNPQRQVTITHDFLHENVDYTPYEGLTVHGWPKTTISRGSIVVEDGRFIGRSGHGQYLQRGGGT